MLYAANVIYMQCQKCLRMLTYIYTLHNICIVQIIWKMAIRSVNGIGGLGEFGR